MAAAVATADMTILKNSQILVNVEEALADLLVVSYCSDNQKFQGVLLDSTKGNLPFGVYGLHPAFNKTLQSRDSDQDKLHSVSQRFAYQEPQYATENEQKAKKVGRPKGKVQQKQKMTVRLRARKVLCSNCQGICNENSENVDVSKKRKLDSHDDVTNVESSENKYLVGAHLIPKLARLHPKDISTAIKGSSKNSTKNIEKNNGKVKRENESEVTRELAFVSVPEGDTDLCEDQQEMRDSENEYDVSFSSMFSSARTLKICFGEGEGTVVKIPPLTGDFNEDSGVSCDMAKPVNPHVKAAKKAMKKAKKQAKKVITADSEPTWIEQSPKHIGALSPRNNVSNQPSTDPLEKKHKYRVKHKKKYKTQKKRDENTSKCLDTEQTDYFSDIKDQCFNQKLSISLRRLSSNLYEKRNEQDSLESGSEDCESEVVPEFPANGQESAGGKLLRVSPGDIVWGKVVGFPWWPGRVLSVTANSRAHVAWYASTTSSLMSCDSLSPFLEDYKVRFNKKKRGPYKEAVKQATIEAKGIESQLHDPLGSPSQVGLDAMSPRPIDVFS